MQLSETINNQLIQGTVSAATFVPGNGAKDLNPLSYFLRKQKAVDPISGGNVGNISSASNTWWRHRTARADSATIEFSNDFAVNVTTFAGMLLAMRRMHNFCMRGSGGGPNLIVSDATSYETYENALQTQVRYTQIGLGDVGFENLKFRNAVIIWDEMVPELDDGIAAGGSAVDSGTMFFLNTKFYKLFIDTETDMVPTPFVEPENQTAKTAKILFMANAGISNMRKHGALYSISQTITS